MSGKALPLERLPQEGALQSALHHLQNSDHEQHQVGVLLRGMHFRPQASVGPDDDGEDGVQEHPGRGYHIQKAVQFRHTLAAVGHFSYLVQTETVKDHAYRQDGEQHRKGQHGEHLGGKVLVFFDHQEYDYDDDEHDQAQQTQKQSLANAVAVYTIFGHARILDAIVIAIFLVIVVIGAVVVVIVDGNSTAGVCKLMLAQPLGTDVQTHNVGHSSCD